jgi:hypothetical protein
VTTRAAGGAEPVDDVGDTCASNSKEKQMQSTSRISHEPYIRQVVRELANVGVATGVDIVLASAPARVAMVPIVVEAVAPSRVPSDSGVAAVEWLTLRWHEMTGWAWQLRYHGDPGPRAAVYFAGRVAAAPLDVACWLQLGLLHPEITPIRQNFVGVPADLLEDDLGAYVATRPRFSAHSEGSA